MGKTPEDPEEKPLTFTSAGLDAEAKLKALDTDQKELSEQFEQEEQETPTSFETAEKVLEKYQALQALYKEQGYTVFSKGTEKIFSKLEKIITQGEEESENLEKAAELQKALQNALPMAAGAFKVGATLMKQFEGRGGLQALKRLKKLSCECNSLEEYKKLSEASLEIPTKGLAGHFTHTEKEVYQTLYAGVAYKQSADHATVEIMIPPDKPPSEASLTRSYNAHSKKVEVVMRASSDRAVFIMLDTNQKFHPLKLGFPQANGAPVKPNEGDMQFVLKLMVAAKLRDIPIVKLDPEYEKALEKVPGYEILEKIKGMSRKQILALTKEHDLSLGEIVGRIAGQIEPKDPGATVTPPKAKPH